MEVSGVLPVALFLCVAAATFGSCQSDSANREDKVILVIYSSLSDFGVEELNESVALMVGNLKLEFFDLGSSSCGDQTIPALSVFIEKIFHKRRSEEVVGLVGPSCTDSAYAVARLIRRSKVPVRHFHTSPMPAPLAAKVSGTSEGLLAPADLLADASMALIKHANWSKVLVLYQLSITDMNYIFHRFQRLLIDMDHQNNNIGSSGNNNNNNNHNNETLGYASPLQIRTLNLHRVLSSYSLRILFLMVDAELARNVLCKAFKLEAFYPAYQWVILRTTLDDILSVEKVYTEAYVCDKQDILKVLKNALFVNFQYKVPDNGIVSGCNNSHDESPESMLFAYECSVQAMLTVLTNTESMNSSTSKQNDKTTGLNHESQINQVSIEQIQNNLPVQILIYSNITFSFRSISENISYISSELKVSIIIVNLRLAVFFFCINSAIFIASVILQVITVLFRQKQSVKSSSPTLLHVCYVGIYLVNLMTDVYFIQKSFVITSDSAYIHLCRIFLSLASFGMTLILGTLAMKTWRLYKIFVHYMDPGKYLSDLSLVFFVGCLTLVDLAICGIWFVFDKIEREYVEVSRNNLEGVITYQAVCESKAYVILLMLLLGYQMAIMAFMIWMICKLRKKIPKMHTNLRSDSVTKLGYVLLFVICFGIPGYWVAHYLLYNLVFEFVMIGVLFDSLQVSCVILLFLPPVLPILRYNRWTKSI